MNLPVETRCIVRFDVFELNTCTGELHENGVLRRLPPQPFRVLVLMIERAGQTVTRQDIHRCLWGDRKYVDSEGGINFCISQIRSALRDPAGVSRFIKTAPRMGYRFIATTAWVECANPVVTGNPIPSGIPVTDVGHANPVPVGLRSRRSGLLALCLIVLMALPAGDAKRDVGRAAPRTIKSAVLIGDFLNTTNDPVFDDTLRLALTIEMRQSPFFDVLSDARTRRALRMMAQPETSRLTGDLARTLCLRTGGSALLEGRIARLGAHYVLSINATACSGGDVLVSEQQEVAGKEAVLGALSRSAERLRIGLGESMGSVQRFDVAFDATTSSLDALKNYSTGIKVSRSQGDAPSMPFFRRAIELDPSFSVAYAALATTYNNLDQPSQALPYATRAFELRDRGTELERLVSTTRYLRLRGEVEKLTQTAELWKAEYPRDANAYTDLGVNYAYMGQYAKSAAEFREAVRLQPDVVINYDNLGSIYVAMNRPDQAQATVNSALARQLDGGGLRWTMYHLAFLQGSPVQMRQQVEWAAGKPGSEDVLLSLQSDTEAYFGHLHRARELSTRAVDAATRAGFKEAAALWEVVAALREAEFGNAALAREQVAAALKMARGRNVEMLAALTLARAGDTGQATAIGNELAKAEPDNTLLTTFRLPSIRAAVALQHGLPLRAISALEVSRPYELGRPSPVGLAPLYPVYLRGLAYLALRRGADAALEFRKILDNPGVALNSPVAALAQLQLARASAQITGAAGAHAAYQTFLSAWNGADPDIPVYHLAMLEDSPNDRDGRRRHMGRQLQTGPVGQAR